MLVPNQLPKRLYTDTIQEDSARERDIQRTRATLTPTEGPNDDTSAQEIDRRTEEARERNLAEFPERTANLELLFLPDSTTPTSNTGDVPTAGDTIGAMSDETRSALTNLRVPGSRTTTRHRPEVVARRAAGALRRAANERLPNIRPLTVTAVPRQNGDELLPPSVPVRSAMRPDRTNRVSLTGDMARRRNYEDIPLVSRHRGELTAAVRAAAAVTPSVTFETTPAVARATSPTFYALDTPSDYSSSDSRDEEEVFHTPLAAIEPEAEPVARITHPDFDQWYSEQDEATRELVSYRDFLHYAAQQPNRWPMAVFPTRSIRHIEYNSILRATIVWGRLEIGIYDLNPIQCRTLESFVDVLTSEASLSRMNCQIPISENLQVLLMLQTGINEAEAQEMMGHGESAEEWNQFWTLNFRLGRQAVIEVRLTLPETWSLGDFSYLALDESF
jgi:hypothetical protein